MDKNKRGLIHEHISVLIGFFIFLISIFFSYWLVYDIDAHIAGGTCVVILAIIIFFGSLNILCATIDRKNFIKKAMKNRLSYNESLKSWSEWKKQQEKRKRR